MTPTKSCTRCGEAKPLTEFYLRSRKNPDGPYRPHCKTCMSAGDRQRYLRGLSVQTQIERRAVDPTFKLSPEAEAIVYTDELDPELVALWWKRRKTQEAAQRRREREAAKRRGIRPMKFAQLPAGAL